MDRGDVCAVANITAPGDAGLRAWVCHSSNKDAASPQASGWRRRRDDGARRLRRLKCRSPMNPVIKFPDMRPPKTTGAPVIDLPTLASYRQTVPRLAIPEPRTLAPRAGRRRRLLLWFAMAVALHAAVFVGIWLTPPLRLTFIPGPERWVQVVSLPKPEPTPPAVDSPNPAVDAPRRHTLIPARRAGSLMPSSKRPTS